MTDIRQTPEYANHLKNQGWEITLSKTNYYFLKKIPLVGYIVKLQRPIKLNIEDIKKLTKRFNPFQFVIEPTHKNQINDLTELGFRLKKPFSPSKTLILDITKPKEDIYKKLKKDCRYSIRKTQNIKVKEIKTEKEIVNFRNSWKSGVGLKRYVPSVANLTSLKNSFGGNAFFIMDDENKAGAIFLSSGNTGYYWQAFTDKKGRKQSIQYKLVWEGIIWSKKRGATLFDFEGVYDERFPDNTWRGFTHFKKSFGGKEKIFPGAFVRNRLSFI